MLSAQEKAGRLRAEKERRSKMLCARLDRHVAIAERYKTGATRAMHMAAAEVAREELRAVDH